ncbi:hypothetical protein [Escherichia albertii]|uniref:hypothetical protein n=1 Tax=Escherichia albertii TaxID=208962 RepID=UPI000DE3D2B5|nr:hypothetical protein [Escherichia albertii]
MHFNTSTETIDFAATLSFNIIKNTKNILNLLQKMTRFKNLNKVHEKDTSCLSLGNGVNEQIIAVIVKVLAFREAVSC